ncbi:MAG: polysaccharide biosynthesis tyrosine autokinase, partial [Planctomycetes bacterium]|nr:polysaccharide biosynthesis tyrosine autokinase [Planctomycetota bacterium]
MRADQTVSELRTALTEAEKEVATLSDTYGPEHPQLQAVQAKVTLLQAKLQETLTQLVGSLTAQLEMLSNQEQELRQQYEEQNQLALGLSKQSLSFNRLQNEVDRQRRLFDVLVERMREVDVTADYARTNVEVVEVADIPKAPIKPKKARTVMLSLFLGLFLGVGLAFFFEYLDDTVKTPEDLEDRVGIPVLGFVPAMDTKGVQMDGFSYRGTISMVEPTASVTEAYRNIRTSLFFSAPAEETKALVVTSGGPSDGKTTTATNLALVIAQSGKRVLLLDADFRRPMVHKVFGLESKVGLSTVLVGEATLEEAVQKAEHDGETIENLDILAAGPKPPNPAELLDSQSMRKLLEEVRQKYDRVIMDSPPVLFVADAT